MSGSYYYPNSSTISALKRERDERQKGTNLVKARTLIGICRKLTLGLSPIHYRFFCSWQLALFYKGKDKLVYTGLEHLQSKAPKVFIMKHRSYADITLHGMGYLWASSGLYLDREFESLWEEKKPVLEITESGKPCRFIMKEDLLTLPIGFHLVMNGGIPVLQDLETKALNQPDFDPESEKVVLQREKMASWFSFKDSYREVLNELNGGGSIMIYGEATRVSGNKMGHIALKFLKRLSKVKDIEFIPVGSVWRNGEKRINYGKACDIENLREEMANLSGIPKEQYL